MRRVLVSLGVVAAGVAVSCSGGAPPTPVDALTYEYPMYLPGLGENVRVVKTLRSIWAHLDDGRVVGEPDLWALEAVARRAKFGVMTPEFATGLRSASADQAVAVGFFFQIDEVPQDAAPGVQLQSTDSARSRSQSALKAVIARGLGPTVAMLRASGVTVERTMAASISGHIGASMRRLAAYDQDVVGVAGAAILDDAVGRRVTG